MGVILQIAHSWTHIIHPRPTVPTPPTARLARFVAVGDHAACRGKALVMTSISLDAIGALHTLHILVELCVIFICWRSRLDGAGGCPFAVTHKPKLFPRADRPRPGSRTVVLPLPFISLGLWLPNGFWMVRLHCSVRAASLRFWIGCTSWGRDRVSFNWLICDRTELNCVLVFPDFKSSRTYWMPRASLV